MTASDLTDPARLAVALAAAAAVFFMWRILGTSSRSWRRKCVYAWRMRRNRAFWAAGRPTSRRAPRLKIVVSLTASPRRLALLEPVLASITAGQTRPPDEVHLNLPHTFGRTGEAYVLPDFLARHPVQVFRVEDVGPATKLVPTLARVTDPETWILTVDDDVRHLQHAFERLEDAAVSDPSSAYGYSDYALWRRWRPGEPVDFLAGFGGCIFRRGFFGPDFKAYFDTAKSNRACFFQDDIVIGNYLALNGVPCRRLAAQDCDLAMMKRRGCLLEQAGGDDALSHGAGSGMDTKTRSLAAMAFLRSQGIAAEARDQAASRRRTSSSS
ncbi:MAG: hypothetical protein ACO3ND_02895 [Opitutales bacterium]